jgi:dynein heavy chain, axonemal
VQRNWQYLQPIFFSEEIIKNMDQEGRKYSLVDKIWRGIMSQTESSPGVMDCCGQVKLKETFENCLEQLDQG